MSQPREKEYKLSKKQKLAIAHKGELRCENCNRYSKVDEDAYEYVIEKQKDRQYVYLCSRKRCRRHRAENLIDYRLVFDPQDDKSTRKGKLYHKVTSEKNLYILMMSGF
jgi:hypothetical protein